MRHSYPSPAALESNLRLFILFRLFYNARFYYPVFTILFLDYGLSLEQFAFLNMVWALTIVIAEVPSGALADIIGHKRLVVFAATLMVIEMAVLVLVPIGASLYLFAAFLVNRVCSGLSEAAASGADEALAYDSLKALGRESQWASVLERTAFVMSAGFFFTMICGALVYDPSVVNGLLAMIDPGWVLPPGLIIKMPIILTFITACLVLGVALSLTDLEPDEIQEKASRSKISIWKKLIEPFRQILTVARWTINHHFVLFIILAALVLDSVARQLVVLASQYYYIIGIPPVWFGFIGAAMSLMGIVNARVSRYLVENRSPFYNFMLLSAILMIGLLGVTWVIPWFGVLFMVAAFSMIGMVNFQSSFYINKKVNSAYRATVLSFRGLALNFGFGLVSLCYTGLIAVLRLQESQVLDPGLLEETVFTNSLKYFFFYFLFLFVSLLVAARIIIKNYQVFLYKN